MFFVGRCDENDRGCVHGDGTRTPDGALRAEAMEFGDLVLLDTAPDTYEHLTSKVQ